MSDIISNTQVLSAAGAGSAVQVLGYKAGLNPASIIALLSAGATLTYSIEVTGDDVLANDYNAAAGNWIALPAFTGLTASAIGTLGGVVRGVRPHVTSYTSGTLTFQFPQLNRT